MNKILFLTLILLCVTQNLSAADSVAKCFVMEKFSQESGHLLVKYRTGGSKNVIKSIELVTKDGNKTLFGGQIRGGHEVAYCNPDEHEFVEGTEKFEVYSVCVGKSPIRQVRLLGRLGKRAEGYFKISVVLSDGSPQKKIIRVGECR